MVVVPTKHDVTLHYGRTAVDWLGLAMSVAGLAALAFLVRWRPAPLPPRRTFFDDAYDEDGDDIRRPGDGEQGAELVALA